MYAVSLEDIVGGETLTESLQNENGIALPKSNKSEQKKSNKSKQKGNRFENEIAKQLGIWLFDDKDALQRSLTSGARKQVYVGDIVPQKQLPWRKWAIYCECKNGYKDNIPTFNNYTIIEKWLIKCIEDRTADQPIIWLISRFHNYSSIFITDTALQILPWKICLNIEFNGISYLFYLYKFNDIIEYKFEYLFSKEVVDYLTL